MSKTLITGHRTDNQAIGRQSAILSNIVDENMIATLALVAKDKGGPELECQIILWSVADLSFRVKFYQEYSDGYFWLQP
jgi:hypothetical protein